MLIRTTRLVVVASTIRLAAVIAHGQTFASADAARELVQRLDAIGVTAIAAKDPTGSGVFVAALYAPGSQLLVVRASHPAADVMSYRIEAKQFRKVYLDLQGTPTQRGKFFVQDSGADGILSALPGSGDVDVLYEDGTRQTLFNSDYRAQHLSEAAYDAKLSSADKEYARLLELLRTRVRASLESSRRFGGGADALESTRPPLTSTTTQDRERTSSTSRRLSDPVAGVTLRCIFLLPTLGPCVSKIEGAGYRVPTTIARTTGRSQRRGPRTS